MFVIEFAHLHHRGISAGTQTFYLFDGEHAVGSGFVFTDTEFVLGVFNNSLGTFNRAGACVAELQHIFTYRCQVEHGIERSHLEHLNRGDTQHFSHMFHGGHTEPAVILLLSNVEGTDEGAFVPALGIFSKQPQYLRLCGFRVFKRCVGIQIRVHAAIF